MSDIVKLKVRRVCGHEELQPYSTNDNIIWNLDYDMSTPCGRCALEEAIANQELDEAELTQDIYESLISAKSRNPLLNIPSDEWKRTGYIQTLRRYITGDKLYSSAAEKIQLDRRLKCINVDYDVDIVATSASHTVWNNPYYKHTPDDHHPIEKIAKLELAKKKSESDTIIINQVGKNNNIVNFAYLGEGNVTIEVPTLIPYHIPQYGLPKTESLTQCRILMPQDFKGERVKDLEISPDMLIKVTIQGEFSFVTFDPTMLSEDAYDKEIHVLKFDFNSYSDCIRDRKLGEFSNISRLVVSNTDWNIPYDQASYMFYNSGIVTVDTPTRTENKLLKCIGGSDDGVFYNCKWLQKPEHLVDEFGCRLDTTTTALIRMNERRDINLFVKSRGRTTTKQKED